MEKITIALNTPLQASEALQDIKDGVTRVEARLIKQENSGLLVEVLKIGTDKSWVLKNPFKKIFIPLHKIDHFVCD